MGSFEIVWDIQKGITTHCYATGGVAGGSDVNDIGGFVWSIMRGTVEQSHSVGNISFVKESYKLRRSQNDLCPLL